MTDIRPFRALRYPSSAGRLECLLAPPYDVISEDYRQDLLGRSDTNIVRVILKDPKDGEAGYARIGETFHRWREDGTLSQDDTPAIYLMEQRFSWEGRDYVRNGILARFAVEPEGSPLIRPHEKTRGPAKEDRFSVLKAAKANFSPIFLFFEDQGAFARAAAEATQAHPVLATYTDDDSVQHTIRAITEPAHVDALRSTAGAGPSYIADGHHRYATAQRYLREVGPEGATTYGYFCPNDDGLLVLPYHRILFGGPTRAEAMARLDGKYLLNEAPTAERAARDVMNSTLPFAFAILWPDGGALVCESAPGVEDELPADAPQCLKDLDTYFLHQAGFRHLGVKGEAKVEFVHSLEDAKKELAAHGDAVAILMRATPLRHIIAVANANESMPPKSTFFHPKVPSGLLVHPLEP
jgi:uncharacterized protein (DUF1015 family)